MERKEEREGPSSPITDESKKRKTGKMKGFGREWP